MDNLEHDAGSEARSAAIDAAAVLVCEGGQGMSAKRGREASDHAAWRRRGKALARVLEAVENHQVDWRDSRHIRKVLEEVDSLPQPDVELFLGVEIAAGWLATLIREFALDENATLGQTQFVINAARAMIENGGLALAAQKIVGDREVDFKSKPLEDELHARKESQKKQTQPMNKAKKTRSAQKDEIILNRAAPYRTDDGGWKHGTTKKIQPHVNEDIVKLNAENESLPLKDRPKPIRKLGLRAISSRLERLKKHERTIVQT
jgi:hypothetical protein